MATVEVNPGCNEGEQKEKLSPPDEDSPAVLNDTTAPLNFSDLTLSQFGISVQSFTPASSANRKDKSRLAQIKARRRSSIGVRGSPETNSLIRFMAQQRMKTPTCQTPEFVRSSPFLPRVASTLRQKMASFQNLMDVEEGADCDPMPSQESSIGCIKTRDYLSDGNSLDGEKENRPTLMTPTQSKRRRLGPRETCDLEIRETSAPVLRLSLKEQEHASKKKKKQTLKQTEEDEEPVTRGPLPSSGGVEEAQAVLLSPPVHVDFKLQACSPPESQQEGVFELQSPSRPPPDDPTAASPARPPSSLHVPSLPSQLEMNPTGIDASTGKPAGPNKKKSVRFGGPLSPEFFDKNLPPSTPLQKGGTPARAPTPGGSLKLRSVLKTPQRSESETPQAQPDLSSPTVFGASPVLKMARVGRMQPVGEDGEIVFPSMEEIDSAVILDTECTPDAQPLNLNNAFYEESLFQILTESEMKSSTAPQMDELAPSPEQDEQFEAAVEAPAQPKNRRRKQPAAECESTSEAPARPSSRKRKQPDESEPVKRSTRSAAKSASGKIKKTSTATRRWNKDVDRSLYSSRVKASKNPTLSPITERLSFISPSPGAQQTPSTSCTDAAHETNVNHEMAKDSQTTADPTMTNTLENPPEDSITSSSKESTTGEDRGLSGSSVGKRGPRRRKVSVAPDQTVGELDERCEDQNASNHEASRETPLTHTVPETSAEAHCSNSDGKLEHHGSLDSPTSDCPPPGEGSNNTLKLPGQRKAKRGRRCSVSQEHQTCHEAEKERGDQLENTASSTESQTEGGAACLDLAPWQADFNFEDVFKPVAARGQRSVRRSLRNQSNAELGSSVGLAWLPRTSPDSSKEARRRTRGRRLTVPPSLPEETQDNIS